MLELLMTAIHSRDEEAVIFLLKIIPKNLLMSVDATNASILHYLARFNLPRALAAAFEILSEETFKVINTEQFSPMRTAIYYNNPDAVKFFEKYNLDQFPSKLHRDAFYNTVTLPINVEDTLVQDWAGMLPIYYAVAAGHVEATQLLLQQMPADKLKPGLVGVLLEIAIDNKHPSLFPLLLKITDEVKMHKLMGFKSKRYIDISENKTCLIEKIEERYDHPAEIVKQLIDPSNTETIQAVIYLAAQYACAKTLTGLLAGFQQDDENARRETIDTIMRVTFNIYKHIVGKQSELLEQDSLEIIAKVCKEDFERHPDWLAASLLPAVESNAVYFIDTFLRKLTPTTKKQVVTMQLPNNIGVTLLYTAVRYNCPEALLTLLVHDVEFSKTNAHGISIKEMVERIQPELMPGVFSDDLFELYRQQTLYYLLMNRIIDTGKLSPIGLETLINCREKIKSFTKKYQADKPEVFLQDSFKILCGAIRAGNDNPLLKKVHFIIEKEIKEATSLSIESILKNRLYASRAALAMGGYSKGLEELNELLLIKQQMKKKRMLMFNNANVSQLLMARMTLLILKETEAVIPPNMQRVLCDTIALPFYSLFTGTFCLSFVDVKAVPLPQFVVLYKKLDNLLHAIKKGENCDLEVAELYKRDKDLIEAPQFKKIILDTEANINITYKWINEVEKTLLGQGSETIEALERLSYFYRFKKVMLELLALSTRDLKKATSFISYTLLHQINYIAECNQCEVKIKFYLNEMEKQKKRELKATTPVLLTELSAEKKSPVLKQHPVEKPTVEDKTPGDQGPSKDDDENHEAIHLEVDELPTYYPSKEDDRVWQGQPDEGSAIVSLKIPGDKKKISVTLPISVLRFMHSFGSDGCALVGGAVRDVIKGRKPKDWDFVANISFEGLKERFYHAEEKGLGAKTKSLLIKYNELTFDTFPCPNLEHQFHLEFLKEKAAKRDFTCNALYINYFWNSREKKDNWQLIDPFGGLYDISVSRLRAVPTPIAFSDLLNDPVRLLRGLIICDRFGFTGMEILIAAFEEKGMTFYDALISMDTFKLNMIGEKLSAHFKERLGPALEKQGFLAPLVHRGLIKEQPPEAGPRFFYQPIQVAPPEYKEAKVALKKKK